MTTSRIEMLLDGATMFCKKVTNKGRKGKSPERIFSGKT